MRVQLNGQSLGFWFVGGDRNAGVLCAGGSKSVVCAGVCGRVRAGFNIWVSTRCLAVRAGRGSVAASRITPLVARRKAITVLTLLHPLNAGRFH